MKYTKTFSSTRTFSTPNGFLDKSDDDYTDPDPGSKLLSPGERSTFDFYDDSAILRPLRRRVDRQRVQCPEFWGLCWLLFPPRRRRGCHTTQCDSTRAFPGAALVARASDNSGHHRGHRCRGRGNFASGGTTDIYYEPR